MTPSSPWTADRPCDRVWWEVRGEKVVAAFCTIDGIIVEAAPIIRKLLRLGNDGSKRGEEARRGNQVCGAWQKSAFPKIERAFGKISRLGLPEER